MIISVLDDFQGVAFDYADWRKLQDVAEVRVIREHIVGDQLVEALIDSDVVVAMRERTAFPAEVLDRLPRLRLLVTTGMQNASIDMVAAAARGITVCGTGAKTTTGVSELAIGMMIAVGRNFVQEHNSVGEGQWQTLVGRGLAGQTLGILGLGRLGAATAKLAHAFGMNVVAWSPNLTAERAAEHGAVALPHDEFFQRSDYVSIHMRLTPETAGLVGRREFELMKHTAYIINTARGEHIDEPALIGALEGGEIAGAALDVYWEEPLPRDHALRGNPRVLALPHIGYVTQETYATFFGEAVQDIEAYLDGNPVRVLSSPAR
jgi:phosphoglycerate dehydrogenase-like enzyme